jgi:stage II sporulation protein AA (anti-sigma F factor antagonist)
MDLKISSQDDIMIASLCGDIDHHTAKEIRNTIDNAVKEKHPKKLNLDFRRVDFMDSSGIGLIMGRYKLMESIEGRLYITNVPRYIARVVKLSGLDQLGVLDYPNE